MPEVILEVKNLEFSFRTYGGVVKAVRDISFEVRKGELLGIVGESGCGKSVSVQCILRLNPEPPGFFEGGEILYEGKDIIKMSNRELRKIRGVEIGFIFQDPMTSLNPTMRVGKQIEEIFVGRKEVSRAEAKERALEILKLVGINEPERRYRQYPHELSGGMKQRVMIAIALVGQPGIIIADEPTTSLDVTIEAQILDILKELQEKFMTSIILITHDLGVVAKMCDRVLVMYGGKIVEEGPVNAIFYETAHPYTSGLIQSIATLDTSRDEELVPIEGTPPDLFSPPAGCPFAARCEYAMEICGMMMPERTQVAPEHYSACWLLHEYAPDVKLPAVARTMETDEEASSPEQVEMEERV
ncbi:MAG: ABC transporter ATP-binding protein [Saccharofermentanales bacterium]|jgi:oligopeptide transport system ATP-binding protein